MVQQHYQTNFDTGNYNTYVCLKSKITENVKDDRKLSLQPLSVCWQADTAHYSAERQPITPHSKRRITKKVRGD